MKVSLRPLCKSDAETSVYWRNNPLIWRFTKFKPNEVVTVEMETEWVLRVLAMETATNRTRVNRAILAENVYVGNAYLCDINETRSTCELHIFIGETAFWGKGVASRAVPIMLALASVCGITSVLLEVHKDNVSALRLYAKCGFVLDSGDGVFNHMHATMLSSSCGVEMTALCEIGSEFHLTEEAIERSRETSVDIAAQLPFEWYDSGRSALHVWLHSAPVKFVALPSYLCSCLLDVVRAHSNITLLSYRLDGQFCPIIQDVEMLAEKYGSDLCFLVGAWFGFPLPRQCIDGFSAAVRLHGVMLLEDRTHSVLSGPQSHLSSIFFVSLRKWIALPDGGLLNRGRGVHAKICPLNLSMFGMKRFGAMREKATWLSNMDRSSDKPFLGRIQEAEQELTASNRTICLLSLRLWLSCDWFAVKMARRRNYMVLYEGLRVAGCFGKAIRSVFGELTDGDEICPVALLCHVPALRDELRSFLTGRQIFCAVHWPQADSVPSSLEFVSLPCDHRYGALDMRRIVKTVTEFCLKEGIL
jgi:diamine N-acetyltransferase